MTRATTNLGGTASDIVVGKVAVSLLPAVQLELDLNLSSIIAWPHDDDVGTAPVFGTFNPLNTLSRWKPEPVPDEQCFEAIKAGIDALPAGTKMFLNGGE
jgi:pyridoxine 4-dehydrogenase